MSLSYALVSSAREEILLFFSRSHIPFGNETRPTKVSWIYSLAFANARGKVGSDLKKFV